MSPSRAAISHEPSALPVPNGANTLRSIPDEVDAFCREHGLTEYLNLSLQFAADCFKSKEISCELEQDYGTDDRWVVVRVLVQGSTEVVLAQQHDYLSRWVAAIPWPERFLIRLTFYFA
jgi:hypothetical protein